MPEAPGLTPSQTIGPFLHLVLPWADGPFVVPEGTAGGRWITGRVLDGAGAPVTDALVETWQADGDKVLEVRTLSMAAYAGQELWLEVFDDDAAGQVHLDHVVLMRAAR